MAIVVAIGAILLSFLVGLVVGVVSIVSDIRWCVIGSFIGFFGFLVIP